MAILLICGVTSWAAIQQKFGENDPIFAKKGYYDYQGTVGHAKIQMSLYPEEDRITGSYLYEKDRQEIELKGKIDGSRIVLHENSGGETSGVFEGRILSAEVIEGTWRNLQSGRKYALQLRLKAVITAPYGHRYSLPGWENDEDLEQFVAEIQNYIINGQKRKLAALVFYPIFVRVDGARIQITDSDQFLRYYDKIFYPAFRKTISQAFTKYLFVNWQGVMLGENHQNIWVTCISNPDGTNRRAMIWSINN